MKTNFQATRWCRKRRRLLRFQRTPETGKLSRSVRPVSHRNRQKQLGCRRTGDEQIETEKNLLRVEDLSVSYRVEKSLVLALDRVSFEMKPKEFTVIVGESGSGKSTLALAITRLLPPYANVEGSIFYKGREITKLTNNQMTSLRGTEVSMIFQEPLELAHSSQKDRRPNGGSNQDSREQRANECRDSR